MKLNFKKRFIPKIENKTKKFTCRDKRTAKSGAVALPSIGETIHMYTGSRYKPQLLTRDNKVVSYQDLDLTITFEVKDGQRTRNHKVEIKVDGKRLLPTQKKLFYEYDGFDSEQDFVDYWTNKGKESICKDDMIIYHWTDFRF